MRLGTGLFVFARPTLLTGAAALNTSATSTAVAVTRAEYKNLLLAAYPPTIGTKECAEIVGAHPKTIQDKNRAGKLPFKNVSLTRHSVQFLTIDVIDWLFEKSVGPLPALPAHEKKRGRPVGSKNKAAAPAGEGA